MKKLLLIIAALVVTVAASAQAPSLEDKIANLEAQVATLQQTICHIQTQIDDVTKQNLSLKQALHLQPTISEYTTDNGLNYRLISAIGNLQKGDVTFTFSVVNTTKKDIKYSVDIVKLFDENGKAYTANKGECTIGDVAFYNALQLLPDTPVEMIIKITPDGEPMYMKAIDIATASWPREDSRFINIPIEWK